MASSQVIDSATYTISKGKYLGSGGWQSIEQPYARQENYYDDAGQLIKTVYRSVHQEKPYDARIITYAAGIPAQEEIYSPYQAGGKSDIRLAKKIDYAAQSSEEANYTKTRTERTYTTPEGSTTYNEPKSPRVITTERSLLQLGKNTIDIGRSTNPEGYFRTRDNEVFVSRKEPTLESPSSFSIRDIGYEKAAKEFRMANIMEGQLLKDKASAENYNKAVALFQPVILRRNLNAEVFNATQGINAKMAAAAALPWSSYTAYEKKISDKYTKPFFEREGVQTAIDVIRTKTLRANNAVTSFSVKLNKAAQNFGLPDEQKKILQEGQRMNELARGSIKGVEEQIRYRPLTTGLSLAAGYVVGGAVFPALSSSASALTLKTALRLPGKYVPSFVAGTRALGTVGSGLLIATPIAFKLNEIMKAPTSFEAGRIGGRAVVEYGAAGGGAYLSRRYPTLFRGIQQRQASNSALLDLAQFGAPKQALMIARLQARVVNNMAGNYYVSRNVVPKKYLKEYDVKELYPQLSRAAANRLNQFVGKGRQQLFGSATQKITTPKDTQFFEPGTIRADVVGKKITLSGRPRMTKDIDALVRSPEIYEADIKRLSGARLKADTHRYDEVAFYPYRRMGQTIRVRGGGRTNMIDQGEQLSRKFFGALSVRPDEKGVPSLYRFTKDVPDFISRTEGLLEMKSYSSRAQILKDIASMKQIAVNLKPVEEQYMIGKGTYPAKTIIAEPVFNVNIMNPNKALVLDMKSVIGQGTVTTLFNPKNKVSNQRGTDTGYSHPLPSVNVASFIYSTSRYGYGSSPKPSSIKPSSVISSMPSSIVSSFKSGSYVPRSPSSVLSSFRYSPSASSTTSSITSSPPPSSIISSIIDIPPRPPPTIGRFRFPEGILDTGRTRKFSFKRPTKYQPSVLANIYNIKAPKGFKPNKVRLTGFEIRPLIGRK